MNATSLPPRAPVVGSSISLTDYDEMLELFARRPSDRALKVLVCNVHSVMSARRDPILAEAIERAAVATPDGIPLVWALKATGHSRQQRVYGPELMKRALIAGQDRGWRHFLYGTTDTTLESLVRSIEAWAPRAIIAGVKAPPFRPLSEQELLEDVESIHRTNVDLVWVGLGMPKQELWIDKVAPHLSGTALIGVGAAFDILAGNVRQAPPLVQQAGLEWLFRLVQEPRRLWRRYLFNNPAYLLLLGKQLWSQRRGAAL